MLTCVGDGIAEHVTVLISAIIAVIIAYKLNLVAFGQGFHSLGHCFGFAVPVIPAGAGNISLRVLIIKHKDKVCSFAVKEHGNTAGDGVLGAVIKGINIVIGNSLAVYGKPGAFKGAYKLPFLGDIVIIIKAHIYIARAVIIEYIEQQGVNLSPLVLLNGNGIFAAGFFPVKYRGVKLICGNNIRSASCINAACKQGGNAVCPVAEAGGTHKKAQQIGYITGTHGRLAGVAARK